MVDLARLTLMALLVPGFAVLAPAQQAGQQTEPQRAAADITEVHHVLRAKKEARRVTLEMRVQGLNRDELTVAIPIWKPGSYRKIDFHAGIKQMRATTADGAELEVAHPDSTKWTVKAAGHETVVFHYEIDWKKKGLGAQKRMETEDGPVRYYEAYVFEGPGTWLYVPGRLDVPQRVTFELPRGWHVATGMTPVDKRGGFTCADYDVLADCPFHLGKFEKLSFVVDRAKYEIALSGFERDKSSRKALVDRWRRIVKASVAMMGKVPFDRYVFMVGPRGGGGLEHLNSTNMMMMSLSGSNARTNAVWDGLVAHEFFHLWNVKRLRPRALGPFDYAKVDPNRTRYLWVCEGFTSYYGDLLCVRAGLWDEERYWTGNIAQQINTLQRNPGRKKISVAEASWTVWDFPYMRRGLTAPDYYNKGQLLGLLLDIEIRDATDNKSSLDDVMRGLYAQCMDEGVGFADGDVRKWCEKVAGRSFEKFFADYVEGTEELPFTETMAKIGLKATGPRPAATGDGGNEERPEKSRRSRSSRWKVEYDKKASRRAVKMRKAMAKRK